MSLFSHILKRESSVKSKTVKKESTCWNSPFISQIMWSAKEAQCIDFDALVVRIFSHSTAVCTNRALPKIWAMLGNI